MDVSALATVKGPLSGNGSNRHHCRARKFALLRLAPHRCLKEMRGHWGRWRKRTSAMPNRIGLLIAAIAEMTVLIGCGGLPQAYFHEDESGRYYDTKSGQVLWVTTDGTVADVTFLRHTLYDRARPSIGEKAEPSWIDGDSKVVLFKPDRLGRVLWTDGDWDLSDYDIAPETGMCRLPMTMTLWPLDAPLNRHRYALERKRHSCLLLMWEAPVAVTESAILYGALLVDAAVHFPLVQFSSVAQALDSD